MKHFVFTYMEGRREGENFIITAETLEEASNKAIKIAEAAGSICSQGVAVLYFYDLTDKEYAISTLVKY